MVDRMKMMVRMFVFFIRRFNKLCFAMKLWHSFVKKFSIYTEDITFIYSTSNFLRSGILHVFSYRILIL